MITHPSPVQPAVEKGGLLSKPWNQWLRRLAEYAGLSPSVQIYRDLVVPGPLVTNISTYAPMTSMLSAPAGSIYAPLFGAPPALGNLERVAVGFRIPNDAREGCALKPWVEWCPRTSASGVVAFRIEYSIVRNGEAISTTSTLDETQSTPEAALQACRLDFDDIDTDSRRGDLILASVHRNRTGDTYAESVYLLSCGLKYVADGVGTTEPHP